MYTPDLPTPTAAARTLGALLIALTILTPHGAAQNPSMTVTGVYQFTGGNGSQPEAALVIGQSGALYGTTSAGGTSNAGTVFELTPPAPGRTVTETVLYSFTNHNGDGYFPAAGLSIGNDGALYGTTVGGGAAGMGTVFALTPPAAAGGSWTETVLYSFTGQNGDGYKPYAGLLIGKNGALYGTTAGGGLVTSSCPYSCGTVFELTRPEAPGAAWKETVLHRFTGQNGEGANPHAALVAGAAGALYGTTLHGGSGSCNDEGQLGCGTVFALSPPASSGSAWTEKVIYSFTGQNGDGAGPNAGVTLGAGGALFGVTSNGGSAPCANSSPSAPPGCGTVFALMPPAAGATWTEAVLYSFSDQLGSAGWWGNGANPYGELVIGGNGVLYGTTSGGGYECLVQGSGGCGTVFQLTPPSVPGGPWTESAISLWGNNAGVFPMGAMTMGANGALYGTTFGYGISDGTVFEVRP